jgi:uncharacterized protein
MHKFLNYFLLIVSLIPILDSCSAKKEKDTGTTSKEALYIGNRPPLAESPFYKLPVGSIQAKGWLAKQLDLQIEGLTGHLDSIWGDVGPNSGWLGGTGESWERGPYYIRGATSLAYTTGDSAMIRKVRPWIEWTLNSQKADGFFGPESNRDWWPRWLMLQVLQTHYEATGDKRVIPFMQKFFAYELRTLPQEPLKSWAVARGGENISSVHWLYNQTGDTALLRLADLTARQTFDWTRFLAVDAPIHTRPDIDTTKWWDDSPQHTVNLSHGLKLPGLLYQQTGDVQYKNAVYTGLNNVDKYHGQIFGVHAGDERLRLTGASRGSEVCEIVENMHSYEALLRILGDPRIADRLEKVAYNALPAALKPDWKAHPYYITPNEVIANVSPKGFSNEHKHDVLTYGVLNGYPCCAVNMHMGWPMLSEHLWLATPQNGLAAAVYAPSEVRARVTGGTQVTIIEETAYPFKETIIFTINPDRTVQFPLMLRIPEWCGNAQITVNGEKENGTKKGTFITIGREWKKGDKVELRLPMETKITRWENNAAGVERGPLVYALAIEENWKKYPDWHRDSIVDAFPAYEILPASAWNYGLILDTLALNKSLEYHVNGQVPGQPWTPDAVPVYFTAKARQIPSWKLNKLGHTDPLPPSPVRSSAKEETIRLLPIGATRLRVSYMPVIGMGQPSK